ncbi:MAG: hypothetical protein K5769_02990 [Pseudobutyrivibrio sp.]|nr:hypothetical protein [Pseudobutyrivibrio sp.]
MIETKEQLLSMKNVAIQCLDGVIEEELAIRDSGRDITRLTDQPSEAEVLRGILLERIDSDISKRIAHEESLEVELNSIDDCLNNPMATDQDVYSLVDSISRHLSKITTEFKIIDYVKIYKAFAQKYQDLVIFDKNIDILSTRLNYDREKIKMINKSLFGFDNYKREVLKEIGEAIEALKSLSVSNHNAKESIKKICKNGLYSDSFIDTINNYLLNNTNFEKYVSLQKKTDDFIKQYSVPPYGTRLQNGNKIVVANTMDGNTYTFQSAQKQ